MNNTITEHLKSFNLPIGSLYFTNSIKCGGAAATPFGAAATPFGVAAPPN